MILFPLKLWPTPTILFQDPQIQDFVPTITFQFPMIEFYLPNKKFLSPLMMLFSPARLKLKRQQVITKVNFIQQNNEDFQFRCLLIFQSSIWKKITQTIFKKLKAFFILNQHYLQIQIQPATVKVSIIIKMKSLSAKRQTFRKELRRNQLDQMFHQKRLQLMKENLRSIQSIQEKQQIQQILNICNSDKLPLQKICSLLQFAANTNNNLAYAKIGNFLIENRHIAISIQQQVLPISQVNFHEYLLQLEREQLGYKNAVEKPIPIYKAWLTFLVVSFTENERSQSLKREYDESIARMILDERLEVVWYGLSAFQSYFFSVEVYNDKENPRTTLNCYKAFAKLIQNYDHAQTIHQQIHSCQVLKALLINLQQLAKDPELFRSMVKGQKSSNLSVIAMHMLKNQDLRQNALYWIHQTTQIGASKYFITQRLFQFIVSLIQFTSYQNTQLIFQLMILHIESLDLASLCPLIRYKFQREIIDKLSSSHKDLQFMSLKMIHYILLKMYDSEQKKNMVLFLSAMQDYGFRETIEHIYHVTNSKEVLEIVQWIIDVFYPEQEMDDK